MDLIEFYEMDDLYEKLGYLVGDGYSMSGFGVNGRVFIVTRYLWAYETVIPDFIFL